jgi:hypothetical protein
MMLGKGQRIKGDERILGDSGFVDAVLTDTRVRLEAKRNAIARAMILNGWSGVWTIWWIWNRMKSSSPGVIPEPSWSAASFYTGRTANRATARWIWPSG